MALRFVLAAALLAPLAIVSAGSPTPAFAEPNVSTVLDVRIATCVNDATLDSGSPLYYDGTLPLAPNVAIDRSPTLQPAWVGGANPPNLQYLCNDHIGSLDRGSVGLLVSVNPDPAGDDPTDASPPPVSNLRLVFTITNAAVGPLPSVCGVGSSVLGGTVTCAISGAVNPGQVILAPITYTAAAAANGTQIQMGLTASATQTQPAVVPAGGPLQNPAPATDSHTVTIDSVPSPINVGINAYKYQPEPGLQGNAQRFDDNDDGIWDRVRSEWYVTVGPDLLATGGAGIAPLTLSNFSAVTDPNRGFYSSATLVSCLDGGNRMFPTIDRLAAPVSTPSCTQTAPGAPITVTLPDGSYTPLPAAGAVPNVDAIWVAGETPVAPLTNRYRDVAVVSIIIEYSAAELLALDNGPSDTNATVGVVRFCHAAPSANVTNAGAPADNNSTDQLACETVDLRPIVGSASLHNFVGFFGGRLDRGPLTTDVNSGDAAFAAGLYPNFGAEFNQSVDTVLPGQTIFTTFGVTNGSTGPSATRYSIPANVASSCAIWDPTRQSIALLDGRLAATTGVGGRVDDWFALETSGTGAPALSTFSVQFGSIPYSGTNLQPFSCNDADSTWVTDPSTLPAGTVNAARLVSTAPIPAGVSVIASLRQQVNATLGEGDVVSTVSSGRNPDGTWTPPRASNPETLADSAGATTGGDSGMRNNFSILSRLDRAKVSTAETVVVIDNAGQTPITPFPATSAAGDPLKSDTTLTVQAGATTVFDVRGYLRTPLAAPGTPIPVDNVRIVTVLPPGVSFVDASVAPQLVVANCIASVGNDCITNPALATDVGYTTLVWNLGSQSSTQPVTALDPIAVTTQVSSVLPANSVRRLTVFSTHADRPTIAASSQYAPSRPMIIFQPRNLDLDGRQWGVRGFAIFDSLYDKTSIQINNDTALAVQKTALAPVVDGDAQFTHRLEFIHQAGGSRTIDVIDVLPYNGDGRLTKDDAGSGAPASSQFTGSLDLVNVTVGSGGVVSPSTIWVSSAPPATLQRDPEPANTAGQTVGSATWPCTYAQAVGGTAGCPSLTDITALRVVAPNVPNLQAQQVNITLQSTGNSAPSVFNNNAIARAHGLDGLFAESPIATTIVPCLAVGNLAWVDTDGDGLFTAGVDEPYVGLEIAVRRASDDGVAGTATTDADGRWMVTCLEAGDYYVTVDSAELLLRGAAPAPGGIVNGLDEDQGHSAQDDGAGGATTGVFTLAIGTAPTGDADPTGLRASTEPNLRDADADFTVDLAFEVPSYTIEKTSAVGTIENPATVSPGDTLEYTIEVTNTGPVAYTAGNPASFTDDLSAVLDDAPFNNDAAVTGDSTATYDPATQELTWSGPLAVGASATVTYSVTVGGSPLTGDGVLDNVVVATGVNGECVDGDSCTTSSSLRAFTVSKSASASVVDPGGSLTYTIEVTNTGPVAFGPGEASFTDNLANVLDDATFVEATNGAVFDEATNVLSWSGALPVGGPPVIITYTVTIDAPASGDRLMTNTVVPGVSGECVDATDCSVTTPVRSFSVLKTADVSEVIPGDIVTYTVTVTNTGAARYRNGIRLVTDDLSDVLDDATYNGDLAVNGVPADLQSDHEVLFSASNMTMSFFGRLNVGETVELTYSVTVNDPATGNQILENVVVTPLGGNCPPGSTDAACTTLSNSGSYTVEKSASETVVVPGGTLEYSVVVTNTGDVDFTGANQASFSDNLSGVLDDATYGASTSPGVSFDATTETLTWSGDLLAGESVTVTYTVIVDAPPTGTFVLDNTVVPTTPGGLCVDAADCATSTPVQAFTVAKTSPEVAVNPGDAVSYTITVTNVGAVAYPDGAPASFTDDLSDVLADAIFNDDVSVTGGGTASFDALTSELSWSGALDVGATVTVTYTVTVVAAGDLTDAVLDNVVVPTADGGLCADPDDCATSTPVQAFTATKTSPEVTVSPGDSVSYTITVTNVGAVEYPAGAPASFTDDLSAVLDDADYNGDVSVAGGGTANVDVTAEELTWSGALAVDGTVTVTYSVTVLAATELGNGVLDNVVIPTADGGACVDPDDCATSTPVQAFTVAKTSASGAVVNAGDVVQYTITVVNTGGAAYPAGDPASFTDDLSAVLDDATYNGDASIGAIVDDVALTLSWTGELSVGATIAVTYSVTVNDAVSLGDAVLNNVVVPTATGGECVTAEDCVTSTDVRAFTVAKTASTEVVTAGGTVEYTITVTNTGVAAYTVDDPASFADDLSAVLDDAVYNDDASSGASVDNTTLSWEGALAVDETVTITYSVTVNAAADLGDAVLDNEVVPTALGGDCVTADECVTSTPVQAFTVAKVASASVVGPTDTLTYTIEVVNTGSVDFTDVDPAVFTDDLSAVLDDAVYNDDASLGGAYAEPFIAWAVSVAAGDSIVVTYSVTVSAAGSGDGRLVNAVVPDEQLGGGCAAPDACETDTPVRSYTVVKRVDAAVIGLGQVIRYEIVVTNTGQADYTLARPAAFVDDLTEVLDDGVYRNDATNGAVYVAPELTWRGPLAVGESITISYSVRINDRVSGDTNLVNTVFTVADGSCPVPETVVLGRGAFSGGAFSASAVTSASARDMPEGCVTTSSVNPRLASTGASDVVAPLVASGLLAMMVGFGLMLIRRRRQAVR